MGIDDDLVCVSSEQHQARIVAHCEECGIPALAAKLNKALLNQLSPVMTGAEKAKARTDALQAYADWQQDLTGRDDVERFCEYQMKCHEDTGKTWTCTAHLDSGRAMECHYKSLEDAKDRKYPCVDAEPSPLDITIVTNRNELTGKGG